MTIHRSPIGTRRAFLLVAFALQAIAVVALSVIMALATSRIAGAYAWAQLVPVLLCAALTVGLGLWTMKSAGNAAWIVGLVAHLAALVLYAVWVFFWTFVFGMDRGAGDFVDTSVTFGVLYGLGLLVVSLLFVGARPPTAP